MTTEDCGVALPWKFGMVLSVSARFDVALACNASVLITATGVGASKPSRLMREPVTVTSWSDWAAKSLVEPRSCAYAPPAISGVLQTAAKVVRIAALTKPLTATPLVANRFTVELIRSNPPRFFSFLNRTKTSLSIV